MERNKKGQFIYTTGKGRYKRKEIDGHNVQYSRYVWEKRFGKIPNGTIVHHIDKNKMNNNINNLALLAYSAHNLLHSKDRKVWNKGLTVRNNKKMAILIEKRNVVKLKTMKKKCENTWRLRQSGLKLYEIAKKLNISSRQVSERLKRYKTLK